MSVGFEAFSLPVAILTDSYKATHYAMYPEALRMVAYGEFRTSFDKDPHDQRWVCFGIRHFIESVMLKRWTVEDVEKADKFYASHNIGRDGSFTRYPYPRDLFLKFIKENDGYFPVTIRALPEGTCAHVHVPVFTIEAEGEYSRLCTFMETALTHLWYSCNVATLSRRVRDLIEHGFKRSVDPALNFLIESRLHDFGMRGASCLEAATIGGAAHLLNFRGSDTMSAAYYVQFHLNNGKPVAQSIPATEHSVMTAWPTETDALRNEAEHFGDGFMACVMDSYDYDNCLDNVVPRVAPLIKSRGGSLTYRPDSGDPAEAVLKGLRAAEKTFGAVTNSLGFKVITGAAVIQGDGVNYQAIRKVLDDVMNAGYSAASVLFGMGGGLLQKHNRDTMSFATKLCYIKYKDGSEHQVMKVPKSDSDKCSMPGLLEVKRVNGIPTVFPLGEGPADEADLLRVVYDKRPLVHHAWDDFDTLRARVASEWSKLPPVHDAVSSAMHAKVKSWVVAKRASLAALASASSPSV